MSGFQRKVVTDDTDDTETRRHKTDFIGPFSAKAEGPIMLVRKEINLFGNVIRN